ncbi:HTH-type transcriptional regulator ImmR [compost metagenome]
MNQETLAEKLKVSKSSVGMYERGQREPSHETLLKIADLFDVSLDYLMGRDDEITSSYPTGKNKADVYIIRETPANVSKLPLLEQIFFDGFLEASEKEKEEIIRYWHEEVKRKRKRVQKIEDNDPSAWDLKDE